MDYTIVEVLLESLNLEAEIKVIPEDKIEKVLTSLAAEKGLLSRTTYEDKLIETCVANLLSLTQQINQHPALYSKVFEFRQELVDAIYDHNSVLEPDNIYIDRSGRLTTEIGDKSIKLEENQLWNEDPYDESSLARLGNPPESQTFENPFEHFESDPKSEWWDRLKMYIIIRKYKKEDSKKILSSRLFYDRPAFEAFLVTVCVQNFEELFKIIDAYGVSKRIAPPMIMNELYELCRKVNPGLIWENAQNVDDDGTVDCDETDCEDCGAHQNSGGHARAMAGGRSKKGKKKKKLFKNVKKDELMTLGDRIKEHIIGQDPAVEIVVEAILRASVGLRDPEQPIGSFIFAGATGIGKTETTKILVQELIKERAGLIKLDCSEYSSDHEYAKLIGAPAGYIGHDEGGVLTNAIRRNPFAVVIFDEVEKASSKVHELMLQIMDEGVLTDGKGIKSSFKDAIIIMTSNVGVGETKRVEKTIGFGDVSVLTDERRKKALDAALKKKFKPEFLNRVDEVAHFMSLKRKDYLVIVDLELEKVLGRLRTNKKINVTYDKKVKNFIYKNGTDEKYGARPLKRFIKKNFSNPLTKELLHEKIKDGDHVHATVTKKEITFKVVKSVDSDEPPFYLSKKGSACAT